MLTVSEFEKTLAHKNALLNIEEMQQKKTILESYPFKLFIEPTQRCDIDCIICSKKRHKSKIDMSMGLFQAIEKELFPYVSEVDFFIGGESALADDFHEMIKTSVKYNFLPQVFTNAVNITDDTIRLLVELGFMVTISLDAVTKELYEKIRRKANFERVVKNIEKFMYYKQKIANPRFHLRFACTCAPFNIDEVPKIVRFAKDYGVNDVYFNNCDKYFFEIKFKLSRVAGKAVQILSEAKHFADKNKIRFSCQKAVGNIEIVNSHNWNDFNLDIDKYAPSYLEKHNPYKGKCPHPWIQTLIRTDGTVMACCQGNIEVGLYKGGDFREIWNNANYQKLRKKKSYYHCGMNLRGRYYCNLTKTSIWGN